MPILAGNVDTAGYRPMHAWRKLKRSLGLFFSFLIGHGAVQGLNVVTGLFLLRQLNVEDYAKYSLGMAFQATAMALTTLGLTDTIIPLVGARAHDHQLVGGYVQSARHLRTRLFMITAPICAVVFHLIAARHGWNQLAQLPILASILLSLFFSVSVSCYSTPLILNRRLYDYYSAQVISLMARLGTYAGASFLGVLGSGVASNVGSLAILLNGVIARKRATGLMELPRKASEKANKEIINCVLPVVPAVIFSAFQPQMALFLVSIFGQTTQIAEVAALTKIGQIFLVFNTFNSLLVEPYVAKIPLHRLLSTCLKLIGGGLFLATLLTAFSFVVPNFLDSVLGPKYSGLHKVVPWIVLSSSVNTLANLIWIMNRSRKWLFWRGSLVEISSIILSQTAFVVFFGVRSTMDAAIFSLLASVSYLVAHGYIMIFGFSKVERTKNTA